MTADTAHDLTCEECEELLPLVADGALGPADDPGLFFHVAECDHCQASLADHDLVTLALGRKGGAPGRSASNVVHFRLPWPAAAAAVLVCGLGSLLLLTGPGDAPPAGGVPTTLARAPAVVDGAGPVVARPATLDPGTMELVDVVQRHGAVEFVVRQGDHMFIITQDALDGGDPGPVVDRDTVRVSHRR